MKDNPSRSVSEMLRTACLVSTTEPSSKSLFFLNSDAWCELQEVILTVCSEELLCDWLILHFL